MKTRLGKIAQLSKPIRDELNHRLENGHQSPELLGWLNSLPETQELLAAKFEHQPITESNLSHWRHGGHQDWRADQLREARIQRISESSDALKQSDTSDLFENFARMSLAELAADLDALQKLRGQKRSAILHHIIRDLARLQNSYNHSRRTTLAWTKFNASQPALGTASPPNHTHATSSPTTPVEPDSTKSQANEKASPYRSPELEATSAPRANSNPAWAALPNLQSHGIV
jgi:hypothetical protein